MSIVHYTATGTDAAQSLPFLPTGRPLHRLAIVRKRQGISRRTLARRLKLDMESVRIQEEETSDLSLSQLYEWQKVLEVPIGELLMESDDALSPAILQRARLVRLMKSALSILESTKQSSVRRMAQTLIEQLQELMPELAGVGPWHAVGQRRRLDELGVAAERRISDDICRDLTD